MARIVISKDLSVAQNIASSLVKKGFTNNKFFSVNGLHFSVHKKKIKDNDNLLIFPNGDFVITIGTCIYTEKWGNNALVQLYKDFHRDIPAIREKSLGNFIVCIKKFNNIYVYTDKYNIMQLYYYDKNNKLIICNVMLRKLQSYSYSENYGKLLQYVANAIPPYNLQIREIKADMDIVMKYVQLLHVTRLLGK